MELTYEILFRLIPKIFLKIFFFRFLCARKKGMFNCIFIYFSGFFFFKYMSKHRQPNGILSPAPNWESMIVKLIDPHLNIV